MPLVNCHRCSKQFYTKPNRLLKGWGKYCSNRCKHLGFKTGKFTRCFMCHKSIYRNLKELDRSKSGKYFCSKSCQTIWRNSKVYIGHNHANWKGGESSYRYILQRSKRIKVCAKCQTRDTRVLIAHHKDKNRQNNDTSNLIWLCLNCHFLVHHYKSETLHINTHKLIA